MDHGAAHATIADLLWPAINFALFAFVLVRTLRSPIRQYFRERSERLKAALEAGARARREAVAIRAALARDLADLPALRERMKADLRATGEQEARTARQALRREVIDEAVRAATVLIRGTLASSDHDRFLRDFVEGVGAPS